MSEKEIVVKQKTEESNAGKDLMSVSIHAVDNIVPENKEPKIKKNRVTLGIKVDEELANKIRSRATEKNFGVSPLIEKILEEAFKDVVVNEEKLKEYNDRYGRPSKEDK